MAWSPDKTRLATVGNDGEVRTWDPTGHRAQVGHMGLVLIMMWSSDDTRLAIAGEDGEVRIWDPTTGHTLHTLTGHTDWVNAVA